MEEMVCPSFWSVPVEHETGLVAAIAGEWDALPRIPQKVDVNDAQAVQQVLATFDQSQLFMLLGFIAISPPA